MESRLDKGRKEAAGADYQGESHGINVFGVLVKVKVFRSHKQVIWWLESVILEIKILEVM